MSFVTKMEFLEMCSIVSQNERKIVPVRMVFAFGSLKQCNKKLLCRSWGKSHQVDPSSQTE